MGSQEERENELRRREQELHEQEAALRLRELEDELSTKQPKFYQPIRERPERAGKISHEKVVLAGKLFVLVVATIICVKVSVLLADFLIIATVGWIAYKLFFDSKNSN